MAWRCYPKWITRLLVPPFQQVSSDAPVTDGARYGRMPQARIRIGISGWRYAPWRGKFYPKGLRQADELSNAAGKFPTIEINGTFYSLQRPEFFSEWRGAAPEGFVFAVKGPRFITHMKKLRDVE